jgi:hypothetical protein
LKLRINRACQEGVGKGAGLVNRQPQPAGSRAQLAGEPAEEEKNYYLSSFLRIGSDCLIADVTDQQYLAAVEKP